MNDTPEQFLAPFAFSSTGSVRTVAQDSPEAILSNTLNVCECPENFRDDLPEFGVPELTWQNVPLQLKPLVEAVKRWEPEAELDVVEKAAAVTEQGARVLTVEVS
jgi:hypothetical protein